MHKKLKRTVAIVLAIAMMLNLTGCENYVAKGIRVIFSTLAFGGAGGGQETTTELDTSEPSNVYVDNGDYTDDDVAVQQAFQEWLDKEYAESATSDAMSYNYMIKDGSLFGLTEPEATLGDPDMSDEAIAKSMQESQDEIDELHSFDYNSLTADQKFTYDVLDEYFATEFMMYDNIYLYEPFSPMNGLQGNISQYFTDYRFDDEHDVQIYIDCLNDVPRYFQGYIDFEYVKADKGTLMADFSCQEVIDQCDDYLTYDGEHFMVSVFNSNIDKLDFLTDAQKEEYKKQNLDAVNNSLLPTFENLKQVMTELKPQCPSEGGCTNYDGGTDYYTYLLKHRSGTAKTPEEVIKMLDSEYSSLIKRMSTIYYTNPDAYNEFSDNFDNLFEEADKMTSKEMIDKLMEVATANYPEFDKIPYTVEFLDKSLEQIQEGILAYYLSPAIDDPDNNLIRVNGLHTDGLWTTLAHEGYPGHMFQNAYYMSTNPEKVRTLINFLGYMEGWAMYTCYDAVNAYDFGGSKNKAELAELYQINDELSYLVMGRVDIGVNYEGWDVSQVRNYLSTSGFNGDAAEDIYQTVAGDPALYQSYVTGYYELKELRQYAEARMGDKFDVVGFNKCILDAGPCQYDLLKEKVMEYIYGEQ